MQDSHRQINYRQLLSNHWGIIVILLLTPLLLYAVWPILPTHDDWAGTTKPDFKPFFIKEHFLFYGYHWRPFDTWIGYIVGRNPQLLWPAFNHILVVLGHLLCSLSVFRLLTTLGFQRTAKNIATLFFFLNPAVMATVTAIDSQNQVYALTFGIMAFLAYIKLKKGKYVAWVTLVFLATLCKENGLMWALISPILAFGFSFIDQKTLKKDIIIGVLIMIAYALAIVLLPKDIIIHPEYEPGMMKMVKNVVKFIFTTFITVDYIYLLHHPSRNLLLAGVSLLLALPFLYAIFIRNWRMYFSKQMVCTLICLIISVGSHLGTVFSMMHTYAGLAMVAVIMAYSIDLYDKKTLKPLYLSFVAWIVTAVFINIHLIDSSIESGLVGKRMAQEAISKTGKPVESVYVIIIEDDYPKLSSFCVIPNEAFGWGWASRFETHYQWPKIIQDTIIIRTPQAELEAKRIAQSILNKNSADCVWIVNHQDIEVIRNKP